MSFTTREARGMIRKAVKRVPEGEDVRHLNITAMMDMMTILLVAFLFQAAVTSNELTASQVKMPESIQAELMPATTGEIIITTTGIVVFDGTTALTIVPVQNGDVDASEKDQGALGIRLHRLTDYLGNFKNQQEASLKAEGQPIPDPPEIMVIADRTTPYRLLVEVIASAKDKIAGYKRFRLIVTKHQTVTKG